jgi:hypothetical protein
MIRLPYRVRRIATSPVPRVTYAARVPTRILEWTVHLIANRGVRASPSGV